jgi:hypothetical protein
LASAAANNGDRPLIAAKTTICDGWFTEGFDTRDLKEVKALLEKLTT